ncbi:hypothetical protein DSO57_1031881 [Entomophthora muscae]|uniref:Uncharacterized protein n=1 Tax=Entomophthora muscae TaxID=34485 RepID=A0ACC2TMW9_9FUNG|nr:hypothetical protein DSO57_1031881 [Entomophthora muscae]
MIPHLVLLALVSAQQTTLLKNWNFRLDSRSNFLKKLEAKNPSNTGLNGSDVPKLSSETNHPKCTEQDEKVLKAYENISVVNQTMDFERWECKVASRPNFSTKVNECRETKSRGTSLEWADGSFSAFSGISIAENKIEYNTALKSRSIQVSDIHGRKTYLGVSDIPKVGSVMLFNPSLNGNQPHYAIVEEVSGDRICISEWEAPYRFTLTTTKMPSPAGAKYIHRQ